MPKLPDISESEWKIMKLLWRRSPLPSYDIIEALGEEEKRHPNTIKTLLNRLRGKKALGVKRYKNLFLYFPLLSEEDCLAAESQSFLERFFGGSARPLLLHFVKSQKLSADDLEELSRALKGKAK